MTLTFGQNCSLEVKLNNPIPTIMPKIVELSVGYSMSKIGATVKQIFTECEDLAWKISMFTLLTETLQQTIFYPFAYNPKWLPIDHRGHSKQR